MLVADPENYYLWGSAPSEAPNSLRSLIAFVFIIVSSLFAHLTLPLPAYTAGTTCIRRPGSTN